MAAAIFSGLPVDMLISGLFPTFLDPLHVMQCFQAVVAKRVSFCFSFASLCAMDALNQGKPELKIEQTIVSPLSSVTIYMLTYSAFNEYSHTFSYPIDSGVKVIISHVGNDGPVALTKGQSVSQRIGTSGSYLGIRTATWNADGTFTLNDSRMPSYRNGSVVVAMLG